MYRRVSINVWLRRGVSYNHHFCNRSCPASGAAKWRGQGGRRDSFEGARFAPRIEGLVFSRLHAIFHVELSIREM